MANFLKSLFVKGIEIDTAGATSAQVLSYNGTKFVPVTNSATATTDASALTSGTLDNARLPAGTTTPVGSLIMFGGLGNAIPASFLLCDGSSLSTTTYASLFAVIGYTYGGSGGSFNLPSLVGSYVALGTSSTSASSGVRAGVALTSGNTSVDHSHANSVSAVGDQSANHTHANATVAANATHLHNNATVAANATHLHNNSSELANATHSHTNGNITTGGHQFLSPSTGNHTHGYFKPNGSGANTTVDSTIHSDHFHFTNGGSTADNNTYHSHGYTNVNADAYHSHGMTNNNTSANHDHGMTNNVQSANHTHTVTMSNANQSVTHTHTSATGALVCFIIKYQ